MNEDERRGFVYALWTLHERDLLQYSVPDKTFFTYNRFTEMLTIILENVDYAEIEEAVARFRVE